VAVGCGTVAEGISVPTVLAAAEAAAAAVAAVEPATAVGVAAGAEPEPVPEPTAPAPEPLAGEPGSVFAAPEAACDAAAVTAEATDVVADVTEVTDVTAGTEGRAGDDPVSACACRAKMSITKRIPATAIALWTALKAMRRANGRGIKAPPRRNGTCLACPRSSD
jgi:hypothetical protein